MRTVLTIAGFDPSSGAGVTADLAVFAAHGMFGTACVTALTVQSTLGVVSTHDVAGDVVGATLDCLEGDLPADGIKIGMLGTADCVLRVVAFLEGLRGAGRRPVVVLDPVARSSTGAELLDAEGVRMLRERLLPLVDWVTPNFGELEMLAGVGVSSRESAGAAALGLCEAVPGLGVLVTGGDQEPPDDLLVWRGETTWVAGERVDTTSTHGTGCALSSAFLCRLVRGEDALDAARGAKGYVAEGMRRAVAVGGGRGPLNLLWSLGLAGAVPHRG